MTQIGKPFTRDYQPARRARGPVDRSKVTRGLKVLDGIDARLPAGRRYADLCRQFAREAGATSETATGRTLIRQAAGLAVRLELLQADQLNGKKVSIDDTVRLSSEIRRVLQALKTKPTSNATGPSALDEYLAREAPA
jgi:hypothetical protein